MSIARFMLQLRNDERPLFKTPWEVAISPTESQQLDKIEPAADVQENQQLSAATLAVALTFEQLATLDPGAALQLHTLTIEAGGCFFFSTIGQMTYSTTGRVQGLY